MDGRAWGTCLRGIARWQRALILSALAVLCPQAGAAQGASNSDDQETVVVTAQRRPEHPQDVPIALTAISGDELEQRQATEMRDLGKVVPSLVMMRTGAFTQPYLRGIGKRSTLGVENSVATYVDGVYLASSIGALLDLRGIERIEVLKGPQGTLFGRNASGGVIQIITRDPTSTSSAEAMLGTGFYGYARGDLYVTGGNDRIAGNLAVSLSRNGGYGTNHYTGRTDQGAVDHSLVARSKWIWRADAPRTMTLAADYQDSDHDFSFRPVAAFPPIGQPRVQGFRDGDQDEPSRYRLRYGGMSLRADTELGSLTFMSLTALRRLHARFAADLDQGPLPLWSGAPTVEQKQFSQEFQLLSAKNSRLQWTAGLYYIRIVERYDPTRFGYGGAYSALLGGRLRQTLFARGDTSSYAAYGQATLPLGHGTRATLGMRYTIERRSVKATGEQLYDNPPYVRRIPGLPLLSEEPFRDSETFRELTWRASLDRRFSDEVMGYFAASRGFQSGGWNLQTPQNPPFGAERLDNFEAGLKYGERSQRFWADASLFYYDYSDVQVSAITPIGSVTANAASAEVYGLELQLDARANRKTRFGLGAQFLQSRFKRFPNATCVNYGSSAPIPYAPFACDVTGGNLPFALRTKLSFAAHRNVALGRHGELVLSGSLAYNSGYFSEPDNVVRQKEFATVDASVEWRLSSRSPSVRFWVLNLTNSRHYESLATQPTAGVLQRPAPPRRFGATMALRFLE
ncbi:TonB-dependent receptor [Sphingomonas sp.]|uniref:TonB-dependent receptor n=1 Tax=Sphingomonas sp. TaxID=28214 RepID=UPI002FC7CA1D